MNVAGSSNGSGTIVGLSPRRRGFNPRPIYVHVLFFVDKVALGNLSLRVFKVSP